MKRDLPPIIHEIGFDFNWSNPKLWELDVKSEFIPVAELVWHFEYPFIWPIPEGSSGVTPKQVLENPDQYVDEYQRALDADTAYPIDIMFWKERWLILDGLHRLMKLWQAGETRIEVRKIPRSAIPLIVKD